MDALGKLQSLKKLQSLPSYCPVRFLCFSCALQPCLCKMHANHEPIVSCTIKVRGTVQNQSFWVVLKWFTTSAKIWGMCTRQKTPRMYLEDNFYRYFWKTLLIFIKKNHQPNFSCTVFSTVRLNLLSLEVLPNFTKTKFASFLFKPF